MMFRLIRFIHRITTRLNMWAFQKETYLKYYKNRNKKDE
jgi:hypothetical protein